MKDLFLQKKINTLDKACLSIFGKASFFLMVIKLNTEYYQSANLGAGFMMLSRTCEIVFVASTITEFLEGDIEVIR